METLIKQTRELGTSAGVLLPRSWLNKQVSVTILQPSKEKIAKDILDIVLRSNLNDEVKGIYLYGSYARNENDAESDIDIFIITQKLNRIINENNYEILLVSEDNFSKNLKNNLNYQTLLKEAEVILNKGLIEKYRNNPPYFNYKEYLSEIKSIVKINKETIGLYKKINKNIPDGIVYSVVLRLRELYLIRCLIHKKSYYKKDFLKITGENAYLAHLRIKRNEKDFDNTKYNEVINLITLSEKWLKELKG